MKTTKKINELLAKLAEREAKHSAIVQTLRERIQRRFNSLFEKDAKLQADIAKVEASREYGSDDGGIYRWARMESEVPGEPIRAYLETYLQECACGTIHLQAEHAALLAYEGCVIIINSEDGGIYYSDDGVNPDTWICDNERDYTDEVLGDRDELKRNALIEAWMEKNGVFPGVFTMDRYGNVTPVDTRSPEAKAESERSAKAAEVKL